MEEHLDPCIKIYPLTKRARVVAACKSPLALARVLSIACANQNATVQLRQSGRVSCRHA